MVGSIQGNRQGFISRAVLVRSSGFLLLAASENRWITSWIDTSFCVTFCLMSHFCILGFFLGILHCWIFCVLFLENCFLCCTVFANKNQTPGQSEACSPFFPATPIQRLHLRTGWPFATSQRQDSDNNCCNKTQDTEEQSLLARGRALLEREINMAENPKKRSWHGS